MNKTTKIKMGVSLPVLAFSFLAAFNVAAEEETSTPVLTSSPSYASSLAGSSALAGSALNNAQMTQMVSSASLAQKYTLADQYTTITVRPKTITTLEEYTKLNVNNMALKDAVASKYLDTAIVKKIDLSDLSLKDAIAVEKEGDVACANTAPSCNSLGYTSSASTCQGQMLHCPFDTFLVFCIENCRKGSFLYSDMTCSDTKIVGKTVIGIVVNPGKRRAMALRCPLKLWATKELKTAVYAGDDLKVQPYVSYDQVKFIYPKATEVKTEDDLVANLNNAIYSGSGSFERSGQFATQRIVDLTTDQVEYPAASFALSLSTEGAPAGKWFLPNADEVLEMVSAKTEIDNSFKKLELDSPLVAERAFWTSDLLNANPIHVTIDKKVEPIDASKTKLAVCPFIYY